MSSSHRPEEGGTRMSHMSLSSSPGNTSKRLPPLSALLRWEGNPPHHVYEVPPAGEIILRRKVIFQKPGSNREPETHTCESCRFGPLHVSPSGPWVGSTPCFKRMRRTPKTQETTENKARETEHVHRKPRNPDDEGGLERRPTATHGAGESLSSLKPGEIQDIIPHVSRERDTDHSHRKRLDLRENLWLK